MCNLLNCVCVLRVERRVWSLESEVESVKCGAWSVECGV